MRCFAEFKREIGDGGAMLKEILPRGEGRIGRSPSFISGASFCKRNKNKFGHRLHYLPQGV